MWGEFCRASFCFRQFELLRLVEQPGSDGQWALKFGGEVGVEDLVSLVDSWW